METARETTPGGTEVSPHTTASAHLPNLLPPLAHGCGHRLHQVVAMMRMKCANFSWVGDGLDVKVAMDSGP